ncbi:MAG TPA: trigger factor [Rhizomicrobium sp.]
MTRIGGNYQMEVTETISEGLRREFKVVINASDLEQRLMGRIQEMQPRLRLKGFRPGKAPVSYLKKTFGKSMMGEIVDQAVSETSRKAVEERSLKPAFPPQVVLVSEIERVIDGGSDLEFTVKVDLMPEFELIDPSKLKIERLVADVVDADIDEAIARLAEQARTYSVRDETEAAEENDAVTIDFVGRIDGEEFAGGKADDFNLVLGSGQFIQGFEPQLVGAKSGEHRTIAVTFPQDYAEPSLAGKEAQFDVQIKEVKRPDELAIDDTLARKLGTDSVATMKERVREQLKTDYARAGRTHMKRRVLDALDATHAFVLPETMVEREFEAIWKQVEAELKREGKTAEDEGKTEDELKKEYHDIAARRVRLGLVLARLGEQNGIMVTPDEMQRVMTARARQYPGQEQQVFDYFANTPQALAELRAPLFEEKVVDFIAELADVTERKVDRDTLFMDPDEATEKLKAAETAAST